MPQNTRGEISQKSLSLLHLFLSARADSMPYNEFCLPQSRRHHVAICTYFRSSCRIPTTLAHYEGDGTVAGFVSSLNRALAAEHYDAIHVHTPHLGVLFLASQFLKLSNSTICTVHNSYHSFRPRNKLLFLPVFAAFRRVVSCSQASYASFPLPYRLLARERFTAIQNGLNLQRIDEVARFSPESRHKGPFTIVCIGRLTTLKNPISTIEAFLLDGAKTSRLTIIGDGALRDRLVRRAKEQDVHKRVAILGLIPREEVFKNLLRADLFVSTSRGEGLPIAVLEAMAFACPVVLSDIGPHREIARGADFIPLLPSDDVSGFARQIRRFREMAPKERAHVGQKCRSLVRERFGLQRMLDRYDSLYSEIVA